MAINFTATDPGETAVRTIQITPIPARPAGRSGFEVQNLPPEAPYVANTPDFVAWQAREASLRAITAYEQILGPLPVWSGTGKRLLPVVSDIGMDINAYYTRQSLEFYHYPYKNRIFYSGASAEIVSHEAGHAILDALRPDLWNAKLLEVAAFHEGFGDCIALMTSLSDRAIRVGLLAAAPDLRKANFVETFGEEISAVIKANYPTSSGAGPRRLFNKLQWTFPETLPHNGNPGTLLNESHAFGQLVGGVYYDLIAEIYAMGVTGEQALWNACAAATKLICQGVMRAAIQPRFLESWGRTILAIDRAEGGGTYETAIRTAFSAHNISISASGFLAPAMHLSGGKMVAAAQTAASALPDDARRRVRNVIGIEANAKLKSRQIKFGRRAVAEISSDRAIDLTGLAEGLIGVVAYAPSVALVGQEKTGPALLGAVESEAQIASEVRAYVAGLLSRNSIAFNGRRPPQSNGGPAFPGYNVVTHAVRSRNGKKVLERIAFACRSCHDAGSFEF